MFKCLKLLLWGQSEKIFFFPSWSFFLFHLGRSLLCHPECIIDIYNKSSKTQCLINWSEKSHLSNHTLLLYFHYTKEHQFIWCKTRGMDIKVSDEKGKVTHLIPLPGKVSRGHHMLWELQDWRASYRRGRSGYVLVLCDGIFISWGHNTSYCLILWKAVHLIIIKTKEASQLADIFASLLHWDTMLTLQIFI